MNERLELDWGTFEATERMESLDVLWSFNKGPQGTSTFLATFTHLGRISERPLILRLYPYTLLFPFLHHGRCHVCEVWGGLGMQREILLINLVLIAARMTSSHLEFE